MRQLNAKEIHTILLNILKKVHTFCELQDIKYYLAYGTLLGAVRHKGFIPWDDDIDICMPRPDYEKFIDLFPKENSRIQVVSPFTDVKYPHYYAKVHDSDTLITTDFPFKYNIGINIDIFPIDAVPNDQNLQEKYKNKFHFYRAIYNIKTIRDRKGRSFAKKLIFQFSRILTSLIPLSFLIKKIEKINRTYIYEDNPSVSIAASIDKRIIYDKEIFGEGVKLKFEDFEAYGPCQYLTVLSHSYGNYMELPPENKRLTHSITAYSKN